MKEKDLGLLTIIYTSMCPNINSYIASYREQLKCFINNDGQIDPNFNQWPSLKPLILEAITLESIEHRCKLLSNDILDLIARFIAHNTLTDKKNIVITRQYFIEHFIENSSNKYHCLLNMKLADTLPRDHYITKEEIDKKYEDLKKESSLIKSLNGFSVDQCKKALTFNIKEYYLKTDFPEMMTLSLFIQCLSNILSTCPLTPKDSAKNSEKKIEENYHFSVFQKKGDLMLCIIPKDTKQLELSAKVLKYPKSYWLPERYLSIAATEESGDYTPNLLSVRTWVYEAVKLYIRVQPALLAIQYKEPSIFKDSMKMGAFFIKWLYYQNIQNYISSIYGIERSTVYGNPTGFFKPFQLIKNRLDQLEEDFCNNGAINFGKRLLTDQIIDREKAREINFIKNVSLHSLDNIMEKIIGGMVKKANAYSKDNTLCLIGVFSLLLYLQEKEHIKNKSVTQLAEKNMALVDQYTKHFLKNIAAALNSSYHKKWLYRGYIQAYHLLKESTKIDILCDNFFSLQKTTFSDRWLWFFYWSFRQFSLSNNDKKSAILKATAIINQEGPCLLQEDKDSVFKLGYKIRDTIESVGNDICGSKITVCPGYNSDDLFTTTVL